MSSFFALPNLVSSAVEPCVPWEFSGNIPESVRGKEGKKHRDAWINDTATQAQAYSAFEGVNPDRRVSEDKGPEEGNPPFRMHAFIGDYEIPASEEELATGISRISFVPNYYERSLSGNVHLVWLLEKPVTFPNRKFAEEFLKLALSRMRADAVLACLDKPAWGEPNKYYTNSGDWKVIDAGVRISSGLVDGWIVEVAEKHKWKKDRGSVNLPLPVVYSALLKKWPQMNWRGDFVEGSQGPSFWIEGSTSPKSAIAKPTGLFTFSAHQTKPFYSWTDLLGKDFVEKHAAELMGKAVEGIHHDGSSYYRQDGHGLWKPFGKEDIILHLGTDRGLSAVKDGGPSEVSRALAYVHNWHGIDGAAPFVFQPTGVIKRSGGTFLNTFSRKALRPSDETGVWGPGGNFPFLSQVMQGFFHPDSVPANPLDYWLSWLKRFYEGAITNNLESGQNVFILGGAGIGKTFLSQGLLSELFGGHVPAENYLMGQTSFNSELFESALWTIDDTGSTIDGATHKKFSSMTKKMAANTSFHYHQKFRIPCVVDWLGRVVITANADEESMRIVPNLAQTILDKIMIFRAASVSPVAYPTREECKRIIAREAPYFARYLLDYVVPQECLGTARFGINSYLESSLVTAANQSSDSAGFQELVEHWKEVHFTANPNQREWAGSATDFNVSVQGISGLAEACGRLTPKQISAGFQQLKAAGADLDSRQHGIIRHWVIPNDKFKRDPR